MNKPASNVQAIHALSPMQEGILFHCLHAPESSLYLEQYACTLRGDLDVAHYRSAWTHVIERHGMLRALFTWERRKQPLVVVQQRVTAPWHVEDWRGEPDETRRARQDAYMAADRRQPIRLDRAPLMRFSLLRMADDAHRLIWTFHHLLLDGWSMRLVLRDVQESYAALQNGTSPPTRAPRAFEDHIAWLRARDRTAAEASWQAALEGFDALGSLGIEDVPRRSPWAESHADLELRLSEEETEDLRALGRSRRLTLNTILRGAWSLCLARYGGADDVAFGATVSGRSSGLDGVEDMVGLFINTIPVRVPLEREQPVARWLADVQDRQAEGSPHELTPLVDIQRWCGHAGRSLFESLLVIENHPVSADTDSDLPGVEIEDVQYVEQSNYPLALLVVPGSSLRVIFVYDTDRFHEETIARIAEHLRTALRGLVDTPDAPVGAIPTLPVAEEERLRAHAAGASLDVPDQPVHARVAMHAQRTPDAVAVTDAHGPLTYAELDARAGAIAARLRRAGVERGSFVALVSERGREMIAGILGIHRAGGAYVPVDPAQAIERTRAMLAETGAQVLLDACEERRADLADACAADGVRRVVLHEIPEQSPGNSAPHADDGGANGGATLEDPAYVIFTSGSTGAPKGVRVSQRSLASSTFARRGIYPGDVGRFCLLSPYVFDSSVAGIFWTLAEGGTLVLPVPGLERDLPALERLFARERITHTLMLPSLYGLLLEHADRASLGSLEVVVVAGEACTRGVASLHFERLPGVRLFNEYGPTEATVWSTVHEIRVDEEGPVPIGHPIPGAVVYVLDRRGRPAPIGVPGEIHVGGPGLADGYVNDPALTGERFVDGLLAGQGRLYRTGDRGRVRADGRIEFLGRVDAQIKVRGHRIEPGEVEAAIAGLPGIREAAVALTPRASDLRVERLVDLARDLDASRVRSLIELARGVERRGESEGRTENATSQADG